MIEAPVRTINNVVADFLACRPSNKQVLEFYFPPVSQARLSFLLEQNRESELTTFEEDELDEYVRADEFMGMLKTNIRFKLRNTD